MSTFTGNDLKAFRDRWKLSRPKLADILGVSRNSLWNYERDDAEVPMSIRLALAAWLNGLPPVSRATSHTPEGPPSD